MNINSVGQIKQPIDLTSPDWRDTNITTMDQWHPHFHKIKPRLDELLSQFQTIANDYYSLLCSESSDSEDELRAHISEEVSLYLLKRMESAIYSLHQ